MLGDDNITKAEAVVRIVNSMLTEVVMRCRRSDGTCNYFDMAVVGYSGDTIESLLTECSGSDDIFIPITLLDSSDIATVTYKLFSNDPMRPNSHINLKEYITPYAEGKTPMNRALLAITDALKEWISAHNGQMCQPPTVVNITDGMATDANALTIGSSAKILTDLTTECGNILLFNVHLSADPNPQNRILFPNSFEQIKDLGNHAKMLYNMSSILPQAYSQRIAQMKGVPIDQVQGCRAMGYNTSAIDFIKFLSIGSVSVNMIR